MFYIGLNLLHVQRDVDAGQAVLSFAQYSRELPSWSPIDKDAVVKLYLELQFYILGKYWYNYAKIGKSYGKHIYRNLTSSANCSSIISPAYRHRALQLPSTGIFYFLHYEMRQQDYENVLLYQEVS